LKCDPKFWEHAHLVEKDLLRYLDRFSCDYLLTMEKGNGGNLHYHGVIIFPTEDRRKKFQMWFNKSFGHFHVSEKGDGQGWYDYMMKDYPMPVVGVDWSDDPIGELQKPILNLFDPVWEPTKCSVQGDYDIKSRSYYNNYYAIKKTKGKENSKKT